MGAEPVASETKSERASAGLTVVVATSRMVMGGAAGKKGADGYPVPADCPVGKYGEAVA